jgi:peptidyl-prolyl cis-trans isomerase B (cyclophilin B)
MVRVPARLAGTLVFILSCAVSSPQPTQQGRPTQPAAPRPQVAIVELAKGGAFTIDLRADRAPNTVANFVAKASGKKYDGLKFHRVENWVVQGGDPLGNGTGGGGMPSELNDLPFGVGAVGIARGPDIKINNDHQWFVVKQDASWLNQQYTNFGQVISGMDVVNAIRIGDVIKTIRIENR